MKKLGRPVTGRAKQHASIKLPARQIAWLKSTGNLSGTIEKIVEEKMSTYGTVNYQGQQYRLTEDASLSNRLFNGGWQDAVDGAQYIAEYCASGVSLEGAPVTIYWQFEAVKGMEPEDEGSYDWARSISQVRPQ